MSTDPKTASADRPKHTPGPWRVGNFDDVSNAAVVQWTAGFAEIHGSRSRREANAMLIAAAPELLESLMLMVVLAPNPDLALDDIQRAVVLKARAAIAKATGESA